ncbi:MAG: organomercurial lyase, partial [Actinomycetota bacterium]|nr:organomercurial lyase [Actinomycetota bacterium]
MRARQPDTGDGMEIDELTAGLHQTTSFDAVVGLYRPLLRLLADGQPVRIKDLAAAAGRSIDDVRQTVASLPDVEIDDHGRIVGYGLTLRETPHRFEIDGKRLYTWCALDTLVFPPLLGRSARIESPCHGTGTPIRITVEPTGVTSVD